MVKAVDLGETNSSLVPSEENPQAERQAYRLLGERHNTAHERQKVRQLGTATVTVGGGIWIDQYENFHSTKKLSSARYC